MKIKQIQRRTSRKKKYRNELVPSQTSNYALNPEEFLRKLKQGITVTVVGGAIILSSLTCSKKGGLDQNTLIAGAYAICCNASNDGKGTGGATTVAAISNTTTTSPTQVSSNSVYASQNKLYFSPLQDGSYTIQYSNGSTKIIDAKFGFTYSTVEPFVKIINDGVVVQLKDLLNPKVDVIKFPALNVVNQKKYLIVSGTNNSTTFDAVLNSNFTKKLIAELQKMGEVELLLYTVGLGIEKKSITSDQKLKGSSGYTGVWDGVVAISQGNNIEEYLEKLGTIKSYNVIVRLVPPDAGTLPIINEKALANKDYIFLVSPEYTDFIWSPTKSTMYENIASTCENFRKKTNAVTISINTLGSNGDLLLTQDSHFYCAPQTGRVVYKTAYSHFTMDSDSRLVDITLAALKGESIPSEIVDANNSGALQWLNQIKSEASIRGFNIAVGLDGASLVGELRTENGTKIASLRIVDLKGTPDLYLGNTKVGEFYLDRNGSVQFTATPIIFASLPGLGFSFNVQNQTFTSNNGNDSYSIDLNTMNLSINGTIVGKVTDLNTMKIQSLQLPEMKAGNITVKQVKYDPLKNALSGIYKDAFFGQEIPIRISFEEDKLFLGDLPLGTFSKYINGQLDNFSQQVMNGVPSELKAKLDPITKGLVINSITLDPQERIITHITKELGNGSSIELIVVLGKDSQGIYFKTLENSSYIKIALEPNNDLLLHIKKFEIRGNLGENLSGELEIFGGTRIHKTTRNTSMEARLAGMVLLTAATNPIAFGAGVLTASNSGSDPKQIATGFVAGVIWGGAVGGAIVGPLAAIPALIALYSEVKIDSNVNFETTLKMKLKDNVFSVPKSKIIGAGGDVNAAWILFGIEQLPNLTLAADASLNIYLESLNLSKSILLSGNGSLSGTVKLLFADIVSADASINSFSILMNIGADPTKESKGQIAIDAMIRASALFKIITITEETLNLTLTHLKADTYSLPIKRTRWDLFSDAKEEGTINFRMTPDRQVSILSSDLRISGRGGTLGECPSTPVTVRGGNNVYIEEGKAGCRIEIRVNLFGKGDGGWRISTIPTGDTKISSLGIDTISLKD